MPGGSGEIGGGSCRIKFTVGDPSDPDSTIETCDHGTGPRFNVRVTFPLASGVAPVTVLVGPGWDEKIHIEWPVKNVGKSRKPKQKSP
jgi:hypothetical protein